MEFDDIIKLLPPIVLGFGGILPALIVSSRSIFADAPKTLLCAIMALVAWTGYWAAFMYWQLLLFNDGLILGFLIFSAALLFWVFLGLLPTDILLDASGRQQPPFPEVSTWGKHFRKILILRELPKAFSLIIYMVALIVLSVAAALYVGPKGRVIVSLEGPSKVTAVEIVWQKRPNPLPISHKRERHGATIVLTADEFADSRRFVMRTDSDALWIAERSAARAVVTPGLAERYAISAEQSR